MKKILVMLFASCSSVKVQIEATKAVMQGALADAAVKNLLK